MPEQILPFVNQNEKNALADLSLAQRLALAARFTKQHFLFYFPLLVAYLFLTQLTTADNLPVGNTILFFAQLLLITLYLLFLPLFLVTLQGCILKDVDRATQDRLSLLKCYLSYGPRLFFIFLVWAAPFFLCFALFMVFLYAEFIFLAVLIIFLMIIYMLPLLTTLMCHLAEHPNSTLVQSFCRPTQIFIKNYALWLGYAVISVLLLSPSFAAAFFSGLAEVNAFDASFLEKPVTIIGLGALEALASVYLTFYGALCYRAGKPVHHNFSRPALSGGNGKADDNPFMLD